MALFRTGVAAATFLLAASHAASAAANECTPWSDAQETGKLQHADITEASGLAASRRHADMLWTHNDSGDEPRLFLTHADGSHAGQVSLEGAAALDWEDMAVGPCEAGSQKSCVYVADIGDNARKREHVVLYRFEEPDLPDPRPARIDVDQVDAIWFRYPGGARDAETLMVHPQTADLYVVEKTTAARSKVFRVPNTPSTMDEAHQADEVAKLTFESMGGLGKMITAGDIAPDGREFTVRTYVGVYTFCVGDGGDFEAAFSAEPAAGRTPFMLQSEALGYGADASSVWLTSEGHPAPLYRARRPSSAESSESEASDD